MAIPDSYCSSVYATPGTPDYCACRESAYGDDYCACMGHPGGESACRAQGKRMDPLTCACLGCLDSDVSACLRSGHIYDTNTCSCGVCDPVRFAHCACGTTENASGNCVCQNCGSECEGTGLAYNAGTNRCEQECAASKVDECASLNRVLRRNYADAPVGATPALESCDCGCQVSRFNACNVAGQTLHSRYCTCTNCTSEQHAACYASGRIIHDHVFTVGGEIYQLCTCDLPATGGEESGDDTCRLFVEGCPGTFAAPNTCMAQYDTETGCAVMEAFCTRFGQTAIGPITDVDGTQKCYCISACDVRGNSSGASGASVAI